jgi:hypothetical protein
MGCGRVCGRVSGRSVWEGCERRGWEKEGLGERRGFTRGSQKRIHLTWGLVGGNVLGAGFRKRESRNGERKL